MSVDVLVVELGVEFGVDSRRLLRLEDVAERDVCVLLFLALLGKTVGTDDFGGRVRFVVGTKEYVMLHSLLESPVCFGNMTLTHLHICCGDV